MKTRYIIVAVILIIGFVIHSIGGELMNIKFLLLTDIEESMKIEIRAVWHFVSIDCLVSGFFLIYMLVKKSINQNELLIDFMGIRMILYGLMFLFLFIYCNQNLFFQVPQWIIMIFIGVLLEWSRIIKFIKK